jgi:hypothetical protein
VDERKISELFRDAVRDVPPPSFNQEDVLSESARLTRKRNAFVAASALGFALLVGGIVVATGLWPGADQDTSTVTAGQAQAPGSGAVPENETANDDPQASKAVEAQSVPLSAPTQGGSTHRDAGPTAGGTPGGCGTADRELATALAGELPAATSAADVVPSALACPTGSVSASFGVQDGPRRGVLSIMLVPSGTPQMQQPPWADRVSGTTGIVVKAGSGKELVVVIEPVSGSAAPPLSGEDVSRMAKELAPRL